MPKTNFTYERPFAIDVHSEACKGKLHEMLMEEGSNRECNNNSYFSIDRTEDAAIFKELDKLTNERPQEVLVLFWW